MSKKIFKKGDAYTPQNGDWCVWRGKRYERRSPDNWKDYGWLILDDAKILDLFNYVPDFEIHREVPDEPFVGYVKIVHYNRCDHIAVLLPDHVFRVGDCVTIEKVKE